MQKQKLYDSKYETFKSRYEEIKNMNEDDIVKMINEEQARVTERKKDIETKVHAKNMEYDELIANKDAVAEEAKKILQQEGEIREDEKIV